MISFAMSLLTSIVVYLGLSTLSPLHGEALVGLASIPFVAVHHVYEALEKSQTKRQIIKSPKNLPTLEGFAMPWYLVTLYSALMIVGIVQAASGIGTLLAMAFLEQVSPQMSIPGALPLVGGGSFFVGRWIGVRSRTHGFLSLCVAPALGYSLSNLVNFAFLSDAQVMGVTHGGKSLVAFFWLVAGATAVFMPIGLVGFWRGRKNRLTRYVAYLFSLLPGDSRTAFVDLAYEEARLVASKQANDA